MADLRARPTVYKGIRMRSRLEAGFAQWLDTWRFTWFYEPSAFATEKGQYLPDFELTNAEIVGTAGKGDVFIEVKPRLLAMPIEQLATSAGVIRASRPGSVLVIVAPGKEPHYIDSAQERLIPMTWVYLRTSDNMSGALVGLAFAMKSPPWPDGYWSVSPKARAHQDQPF